MRSKIKIALVVSHPIQHFCPQYVSFAENKNIVFKVFFASRLGLEKYVDVNFRQEISWGNLQIEKFDHEFLNGAAVIQSDKHIDAPSLDNALNIYQPHLVITYGYYQKLQRRAHRWASKNNTALAYISDSELRQKRSRLKETIKYLFLRKYFASIQYFFTVGDANEAFYANYGVPAKKMVRMHFPIDVKMYEKSWLAKAELRNSVRLKYDILHNDVVLTVVGKLVAWKNQDHIIDALQLLENEGNRFHLFIIGSGEMRKIWEDKAASLKTGRIHFTGFVNIDELPAYYAATDIYIHPASIEPHSIAVSEAIYMGCPVIISDTCGSYGDYDDVQKNNNGYVFQFGNIEQLAKKIKQLAENSVLREEFGKYSHEIAVKFQQSAHDNVLVKLAEKIHV
jgi:glycosyltransferase involved in cell wall biosynthesis